jgi:hypothetical protein
MTKSDHREPVKFVGMYFIDEHGEEYRTGQIVAQISDGYYLAEFDGTDDKSRTPRWKCCATPTSTRSSTIVAHAIGNSSPISRVGRDGSLG